MTLFLRNSANQSIVDIEFTFNSERQDLRPSIIIEHYSRLLLANLHRAEEVIADFDEIDQLRGWFWEVYMENANEPSSEDCLSKVKEKLIAVAKKYDLGYVED